MTYNVFGGTLNPTESNPGCALTTTQAQFCGELTRKWHNVEPRVEPCDSDTL